jgi:carotenoid cleavage dioxygenase-like enzyme
MKPALHTLYRARASKCARSRCGLPERRVIPMRSFPTGPEFTGLNAPIGAEYELEDLPVEGRIPAEIAGTFFRAIPDPAFPPYIEDGAAVISGDGMVSALRFAPALREVDMRLRSGWLHGRARGT